MFDQSLHPVHVFVGLSSHTAFIVSVVTWNSQFPMPDSATKFHRQKSFPTTCQHSTKMMKANVVSLTFFLGQGCRRCPERMRRSLCSWYPFESRQAIEMKQGLSFGSLFPSVLGSLQLLYAISRWLNYYTSNDYNIECLNENRKPAENSRSLDLGTARPRDLPLWDDV